MYYSHPCSYCGKVFYTYLDGDRYKAAEILHDRIVEHLHAYGEHDKEFDFDDGREIDMMEVYNHLTESSTPPPYGYAVYEGAVLPEEYNHPVTKSEEPLVEEKETISEHTSRNSSEKVSQYGTTITLILTLLFMVALLVFLLYPYLSF